MKHLFFVAIVIVSLPIMGAGCFFKTQNSSPLIEENGSSATSTEARATGGYNGTVDVTIVSKPPGVKPNNFVQKHTVDVSLKQIYHKPNGLFWEGDWNGIMTMDVKQDLGSFNSILNGTGQITQDEVNTQKFEMKMHLVANSNGTGFSSESYYEGKSLTDVTVNAAGQALGQNFANESTVSSIGQGGGKNEVIMLEQTADYILIKPKHLTPFDAPPTIPYVDYIINNSPSIRIERILK